MKQITICQTKNGLIVLNFGAHDQFTMSITRFQQAMHSFNNIDAAMKHIRKAVKEWAHTEPPKTP